MARVESQAFWMSVLVIFIALIISIRSSVQARVYAAISITWSKSH